MCHGYHQHPKYRPTQIMLKPKREPWGRRPRKSTILLTKGTSENECRPGVILGNLRRTQHRLLHSRKPLSERVLRVIQHNYYSTLSEGNEDFQADDEEHDQSVEYSSLSKSIFGTRKIDQARQG